MSRIERYVAPKSLAEAAELLAAGEATLLAGGTDLMPQAHAGRIAFHPLLLNLKRVPELQGLRVENGVLHLGALVTITEILASPLVRERLSLLWQACDRFASDQIRNAATIGGNLCNASPAGDTLPPLLALGATVALISRPNGSLRTRNVPVESFFTGPGRTVRTPAEILAAITIPLPPAGFRGAFYKHGTRPALDISTISIAAGAQLENGRLRNVRIALGAVAPTPIRAPRTEAALEGRAPDAEVLESAAQAVLQDARPISDVRASNWYRSELLGNMLKRTINHVCTL